VRESIFVSNVRLRVWPRLQRGYAVVGAGPRVMADVVTLACSNSWHRVRARLRRRTVLERLNRQWGTS
jgi:hypothetical protein